MKQYRGLTSQAVEESREKYGDNKLDPPRTTKWKVVLSEFSSPVLLLLLLVTIISVIIGISDGYYAEQIGIAVSVVIWILIKIWSDLGIYKEFTTQNILRTELRECKVVRDGEYKYIPINDIVVGDVVLLTRGDIVPADGVILDESYDLILSTKNLDYQLSYNQIDLMKKPNVLRGTLVKLGYLTMKVKSVGKSTVLNSTNREFDYSRTKGSDNSLKKVTGLIISYSVPLIIIVYLVLLMNDSSEIFQSMLLVLALAVVSISEGLNMIVPYMNSVFMKKLRKRYGILMKNPDTFSRLYTGTKIVTPRNDLFMMGDWKVTKLVRVSKNKLIKVTGQNLNNILTNFCMTTTAYIDNDNNIVGSSLEGALLRYAKSKGVDYKNLRQGMKVTRYLSSEDDDQVVVDVKQNSTKSVTYFRGSVGLMNSLLGVRKSTKLIGLLNYNSYYERLMIMVTTITESGKKATTSIDGIVVLSSSTDYPKVNNNDYEIESTDKCDDLTKISTSDDEFTTISFSNSSDLSKDMADVILPRKGYDLLSILLVYRDKFINSLRKFIYFQITMGLATIIAVLLGAISGSTTPLSVVDLLFINISIDLLAAIVLVSSANTGNCTKESLSRSIVKPELLLKSVVSGIIVGLMSLPIAANFINTLSFSTSELLAYLMIVGSMMILSLSIITNDIKSPTNKVSLTAIALISLGTVLIVQYGGSIFKSEPLDIVAWGMILLYSVFTIIIIMISDLLISKAYKVKYQSQEYENKMAEVHTNRRS